MRMVRTTRSLECLVATAMVCGCLVWRFASPPVTPEWVELLRLRKENDRLLQRLKAHECTTTADTTAPSQTAAAAPPCDDGARALLSGSRDSADPADDPEEAAARSARSKGSGGHALGADELLREQVLDLQRELRQMRQKEAAARALPAVLPQHAHAANDTLLLAHAYWDWRAIVKVTLRAPNRNPNPNPTLALALALALALTLPTVQDMLQPWPRIEAAQLEAGVANCHNSSMYCARLQVHRGGARVSSPKP